MKTTPLIAKITAVTRGKFYLIAAFFLFLFVLFISFSFPLPSLAAKPSDIPSALKPWKQWVLHNLEEQLCPTDYNHEENYRCVWPSRLELFVEPFGGRFVQHVVVYAESWVALPGSPEIWPTVVKLAEKKIPVMNRSGTPAVQLPVGEHVVSGYFSWREMPEVLQIPVSSGLIKLTINDQPVVSPVLDKKGRLWLQKRSQTKNKENRMDVRIFRLLDDEIPMKVTNHLQIDISGQAREESLPEILLKDAIPMQLDSPLPARIGPQGQLMLQARPGRWTIQLITRQQGSIETLGPVRGHYGTEVWSFRSRNHLRMVKISGVDAIDPAQADVPSAWKRYPAYVVKPEATIVFKELRRGDPDPAPDRLNLQRTWWLDFDGRGFAIQDSISGIMSQQWYLTMNPPIELGRIAVDGRDQLITMHGDQQKPGVELRRGHLNLQADARLSADAKSLPAVGWDHNFQNVSAVLNLPPGWRLLTAQGVDVIPGTWFQRWTLLDFFLVLIIALAFFKLKNWRWGFLATVTLAIVYHEAGAPRTVWLHLLAMLALLRVLPEGWLRKLVSFWGVGAVVALLVISIPFMVNQIRLGLYPQIEQPGDYSRAQRMYFQQAVQVDKVQVAAPTTPLQEEPMDEAVEREVPAKKSKMRLSAPKRAVFAQDPNALIQTGPGLPTWQWRSIRMQWNGPVAKNHQLRLWLLTPSANLVLAFMRVILLAIMIFGLVNMRYWWQKVNQTLKPTAAAVILVLLVGWQHITYAEKADFAYPPPEILQQLQERLLEKADCYPQCANMVRMDLTATDESLQFLLEVHAAAKTAVPLPGNLEAWLPEAILLDEKPIKGLAKDTGGGLWALIPEGIHRLSLIGKPGARNTIQIPIPLTPHRVTVHSTDWEVQGVHPNGTVDAGIQLIRRHLDKTKQSSLGDVSLPPFLNIERVFHLGLNWQISTTIKRLTPPGIPIVISLPLLKGESVTASGIQVENGKAIVNMEAQALQLRIKSVLEMAPEIRLRAPQSVTWTETWILDASPIWHCDLSGIPVVHHQDQQGHWRPNWRPWPGEQVVIAVSRPQAIPGKQVTIDKAQLDWTPGRRLNKAGLDLAVRTSRGGQHTVTLPRDAKLQVVKINNESQPIRQTDRNVTIPLLPGNQKIYLEWHQPAGGFLRLKGPRVAIGEQAVNAGVSFHMPRNQWILWTSGPPLGPAVLFWTYLLVVILAAIGLGRIKLTPLKTRHWLLLSLGLTQVSPIMAIVIVGWLLVLGVRGKYTPPDKWLSFNFAQLVLVIWTLVALFGLYLAVERGLLGIPNMQIAGNGSSNLHLHWTQDRIGELLPQPGVMVLPQWVFHLLMLFWSLWLAFALLRWLKWGWQCYIVGGIWKKWKRRKKKAEPPPIPQT
ncbi:MAG: hypothetical protein PVF79_12715 [Desulfobacterales bacterium]|jgi:hypothetical protein